VDVAMGQIPRSTERISSFLIKIVNDAVLCTLVNYWRSLKIGLNNRKKDKINSIILG